MSDLTDRIKKHAAKHKEQFEREASEEGRAKLDAEHQRKEVAGKADEYWNAFVRDFMDAGKEIKAEFADDHIDVYDGPREVNIHKGKFPSIDVRCHRTNDNRVIVSATLGTGGGQYASIEDGAYVMSANEHGLYLRGAYNPNNSTEAPALIERLLRLVIDNCMKS
jgi:hypothetical protein